MTVAVLIQECDGQFSASLAGSSALQVVRSSRAEAIAALQQELVARVVAGELLELEVPPLGISSLAGKFRDDPTLREICEQAYRERDAELSD